MNLKFIVLFIFPFFLMQCAEYNSIKNKHNTKQYFSSSGFALIYDDKVYSHKIVNRKLENIQFNAMHSHLKRNTLLRISNPINSKAIELKLSSIAHYPQIFNIVINKKVATFLELDFDNPYVEILELKKNKTFIAKEGTIFDIEKNVAGKAPVDKIEVDNIAIASTETDIKKEKNKEFFIIISDFYYEKTALNLMKDLVKKNSLKSIEVKKINNNKYRLLVGPFKNFNALKTTYISLNNLGFESLNIYRK